MTAFQLVRDSSKINSLINVVYSGKNELSIDPVVIKQHFGGIYFSAPCDHVVPAIFGKHKPNLFYLTFDHDLNKWMIYHNNSHWTENNILECFTKNCQNVDILEKKSSSFIGFVINGRPEITQSIKEKGANTFNWLCYSFVDFKNNLIYTREFSACGNFCRYVATPIENHRDIIVMSNSGSGAPLTHLNPQSPIDMIFSTLKLGKSLKHTRLIMDTLFSEKYLINLLPTIDAFWYGFEKSRRIKPKEQYSKIYQLFDKHDKEYFDFKMGSFEKEVVQMYEEFGNSFRNDELNPETFAIFMTNFIENLKKDLFIELCCLYQRLRLFPNERIILYRKFPNHPYVKIVKMIHRYYLDNGKYISNVLSFKDIDGLFEKYGRSYEMPLYDQFVSELLGAITQRSDIFVFMYNTYLDTCRAGIKPNHKTSYDYFPLKVFSAKLFVMEHLLIEFSEKSPI